MDGVYSVIAVGGRRVLVYSYSSTQYGMYTNRSVAHLVAAAAALVEVYSMLQRLNNNGCIGGGCISLAERES